MSNIIQSPEMSAASSSTAMTTPERLDQTDNDNDNDIWESDSHDDSLLVTSTHRPELLSDLPTVKRQHMTDGYREGLTVGKAKVMQQGFDDGYPIGTAIALRVGRVLGVLEGYLASKSTTLGTTAEQSSLKKVHDKAQEELACSALLKDMADDVIAEMKTIPPSIELVIRKWERLVFGEVGESERPDETTA